MGEGTACWPTRRSRTWYHGVENTRPRRGVTVGDSGRRCATCGAVLVPAARWCGRCGTARVTAGGTRSPRSTSVRLIVAATVAAGIVTVAVAAGLVAHDSPGTSDAAVPDLGSPVEVGPRTPDAAPNASEGSPPGCARLPDGGPCGPPLAADSASLSAVAPHGTAVVYLARRGGEIARFDLPPGVHRWRTTVFPGADMIALRAVDGPLLAARPGELARLDPATGEVRWRHRLAGTTTTPPRAWALDGGVLVLDGDRLEALDLDDGSPRWRTNVSAAFALPTESGLLTVGNAGGALWHPQTGEVWSDRGLLPVAPDTALNGRAHGPLPLWRGGGLAPPTYRQTLFDASTGALLADVAAGPTRVTVTDEVTLQLTWPRGEAVLEVVAFGRGDRVEWTAELPLACCRPVAVPAGRGRIAVASPREGGVVVAASDGRHLAEIRPPAEPEVSALVGVAGELALWRTSSAIVGASLDGTALRLEIADPARLLTIEPLLVAGSEGIVNAEPLTGRHSGYGPPTRPAEHRGARRRGGSRHGGRTRQPGRVQPRGEALRSPHAGRPAAASETGTVR